MNLKQLLQHFIKILTGIYDEPEIRSIFSIIVEHISGLTRNQMMFHSLIISEEQMSAYLAALALLRLGKPVQYVVGETSFYGLPFKVNAGVLIPRPETEELVAWIIETCGASFGKKILDIGTGSGCIAITLKKKLSGAEVSAIEITQEALLTAKENAFLNEVSIEFIEANILNYSSIEKYDVIVSNPPYIRVEEMAEMHQNVLENEPHTALFVPNEHPLLFYEAIAEFAKLHLNEKGLVFFEINEYLGKETIQMLSDKSFINIELRKDMQGKDRMISCRLSELEA